MKLGPVTKLGKRNKTMSKKFTVKSCQQIVTLSFSFYGQFEDLRKPDSGCVVCKTNILINSYLTKTENRTKNSLTHLSYYCFE